MVNYIQDPKLRSITQISQELGKIKFAKGTVGKKHNIVYVKVSQLKISSDYQRYVQTSTLKKAKQFNYTLCQALFVAKRPDNTLVVVDGQHKAIMAYLGGGDEDIEIPCMIYEHEKDRSLCDCISIEAEFFSDLNTTRKNTSTLDKVRAGLSFGDTDAKKFEDNFIALGINAEGIGYEDGPIVNGFAKAVESIKRWDISNSRKAVDYLKDIYFNKWNLNYIDGSMIGALAGIFNLLTVVGKGEKANGIKIYLKDHFHSIGRSDWTKDSRGNSDIIIARRIIGKYNDAVRQNFVKGATIGPEILSSAKLGDPDNI
jgi:hypothetical protein